MKGSDIEYAVMFLNHFRKTKGDIQLPKEITKGWLLKGVQEEKIIQRFLESLRPGDILLYRDFDGGDYGVFEETVLKVDFLKREITVQDCGTFGQPVRTLNAYLYGHSIVPEIEFNNEYKKKWKM